MEKLERNFFFHFRGLGIRIPDNSLNLYVEGVIHDNYFHPRASEQKVAVCALGPKRSVQMQE